MRIPERVIISMVDRITCKAADKNLEFLYLDNDNFNQYNVQSKEAYRNFKLDLEKLQKKDARRKHNKLMEEES